jgi:hypothetical protein
MSETRQTPSLPGWVFVTMFLVFCTLMAAGTLLVTWSAQQEKPRIQVPPEIGHELVPSR